MFKINYNISAISQLSKEEVIYKFMETMTRKDVYMADYLNENEMSFKNNKWRIVSRS